MDDMDEMAELEVGAGLEVMPDAEPEPTRDERVAQALTAWSRLLTERARPNALLHYRDRPTGTLDLTHAHPSGLAMLLAGRPCRLSALVREPAAMADARRRARAIRMATRMVHEERGLFTGWLAVGLASWDVPDGVPAPAAPVLLRSCTFRPRGAAGEDFDLDLGSEVELNPVLVHHLAVEHGIRLDGDVIAELAMRGDGFDPEPVLERVRLTCRTLPGFTVEHRYVAGTFSSAWLPALDDLRGDLEAEVSRLAAHDVVAALAGDPGAQEAIGAGGPGPAGGQRPAWDLVGDPRDHLVLDADEHQWSAVASVLDGANLVIEGAPGTGRSQTVANLVAVLAAAGRRVLLVAQKRAAIETVLGRLSSVGLGDLVLDVPDGGVDRQRIVRELAATVERAGGVPQPDDAELRSVLQDCERQLADHIEALHEVRQPWGSSAYQAQVALAELTSRRPAPRSRVRVRGESLQRLDPAELDRLRDELGEAARLGVFGSGPEDDPWFGAQLTTADEAERALALATALTTASLSEARTRMTALLDEVGMPQARSVADWDRVLALIVDVRASLEAFSPQVYDTSLADVVAATASAQWRADQGVRMRGGQRRRLRRQARSLLRPGRPPADLHAALVAAADQRERWQALAGRGSTPRLPTGLAPAERILGEVHEALVWLSPRLEGTAAGAELMGADLDALAGRLGLLVDNPESLPVVPRVVALRERLRAAGLEPLLDDLAARNVAAEDVGAELDLVWWTSLLEHTATTDPRYGRHDGQGLREVAERYAEADRAVLRAGARRVRRATAQRLVRALDRHRDQAAAIEAESTRARRHRPVREFVRAVPDLVGAARPCWAMSPLTVAQVLPQGELFDVVVVDEASLVLTADAIAAISRARQVVLVGDRRQLGPAGIEDSGSDRVSDDGGGSVLTALAELVPVVTLPQRHRPADERLTAFVDTWIYDGAPRSVPPRPAGAPLSLQVVEGTGMLLAGQDAVESTAAEVDRVVELVIDHVRTRPGESLGVVTLNPVHAQRVRQALRRELAHLPDVAAFVNAEGPERFFVKNVSHAQGDVRDVILLSVGYGRTPHGRVLHRFGALGGPQGERLLAVALTRARRRMTVVAAFGADDLDPTKLSTDGARMLRAFLAYAADPDAGAGAAEVPADDGQLDVLLADLAQRLRGEGLLVVPRLGGPGGIDLAVGPEDGPLLVAVESDGPAYAALGSVRDRDRLRPEALRRRGWVHHRVWSTDVFRDPAREVARVRATVAQAQAQVQALAAGSGRPVTPGSPLAAGRPSGADRPGTPGLSVRWADTEPRGTGGQGGVPADRVPDGDVQWDAVAIRPAGLDRTAARRGPRPRVPTGRPIEGYQADEIDAVVSWIRSDTLLRTREQTIALVRQQLGIIRRSDRIDAVIAAAIERVQSAERPDSR